MTRTPTTRPAVRRGHLHGVPVQPTATREARRVRRPSGPGAPATVLRGLAVGAPLGAAGGALVAALTAADLLVVVLLGAGALSGVLVLVLVWWVALHHPDPPEDRCLPRDAH